ncbi:MAG TPA: glycosyltransferase family 4 protein [Terriglobales bacterium]|nr:glycosyltransferase family 4 protein [Terriglobales bacterium]
MEKENKLIFVGNFNFKPTLDGLIYFLKNIMPLLKKEIPKLEIKIVGPYPEKKLKFWKNEKNLLFTGYVVDVRPYIWESTVEIIPLRIASGVRLKILEGMALGKPMVSTSIGCEGLEVIDNQHLFIADSPVEFAKKTVKLLESPDLRKKFSENSRRLVEQKYNWREIVKNLERIYLQLVESKWKLSS